MVIDPPHADFPAGRGGAQHPLHIEDTRAVQERVQDAQVILGRLLLLVRQGDRDARALLALAWPVKNPDGLGGSRAADGLGLAVCGPLVCALHRELVRARQKPRAARAAGRTVENAIVVAAPGDLPVEMILRQDRETAVADRVALQEALAANRALVDPCMWLILIIEDARDPAMFLVSTGQLIGSGAMILKDIELLGRQFRRPPKAFRTSISTLGQGSAKAYTVGISAGIKFVLTRTRAELRDLEVECRQACIRHLGKICRTKLQSFHRPEAARGKLRNDGHRPPRCPREGGQACSDRRLALSSRDEGEIAMNA